MNYVIVFAAFFTLVLIGVWYGFARKSYTGPKVCWPLPVQNEAKYQNELLDELLQDEVE
jgi:hypothetical protein